MTKGGWKGREGFRYIPSRKEGIYGTGIERRVSGPGDHTSDEEEIRNGKEDQDRIGGLAMINAVSQGYSKQTLENPDIAQLARTTSTGRLGQAAARVGT
jgi:hypothetical protein